jgi:hypothetical protein
MFLRYGGGPDGRTPWNDDSTFGFPSDKLRGPPSAPQSSHPNIIGCSAQTHSSTSVHSPAIHLMTLGVNIAAVCRLETLTALV